MISIKHVLFDCIIFINTVPSIQAGNLTYIYTSYSRKNDQPKINPAVMAWQETHQLDTRLLTHSLHIFYIAYIPSSIHCQFEIAVAAYMTGFTFKWALVTSELSAPAWQLSVPFRSHSSLSSFGRPPWPPHLRDPRGENIWCDDPWYPSIISYSFYV